MASKMELTGCHLGAIIAYLFSLLAILPYQEQTVRKLSAVSILLLTLGYLVWPVDIIPDVFLGVGQVDDLTILIAGVTQAYRLWKKSNEKPSVPQ